jgi:hypothetical protein
LVGRAPVQPQNVQLERLGFGSAPPAELGDGRAPPADDVLRPLARPARCSSRPRIRHADDNDTRVGKHTAPPGSYVNSRRTTDEIYLSGPPRFLLGEPEAPWSQHKDTLMTGEYVE